jgi:hypothetical protein
MIQFVCSNCPAGYQISGTWFKIQELLVAHPRWQDHEKRCPLCDCVLLLHSPRIAIHRDWRRIGVEEFFKALCGFGLPEEIGCTPDVVSALLKANPIVGIDMAAAGEDRTAVYAIILDNNLRLHLVSSPDGPCIYKITRTQHGDSNSSHLSKEATDVVIQRPHQGVPTGGQEVDVESGVSNADSNVNAEGVGGAAPADTALQKGADLDAGRPMGTTTGGSSNSASTQVAT